MKRLSVAFSTRIAILFTGLTAIGFITGCSQPTPPPPPPPAPAATTPAEPAPAKETPPKAEPTTETKSDTTPSQPAPAETAAAVPAGPHKYVLTPETSILWAGSVALGTRKGGWTDFSGTIELDGENFETAKIEVTVQMNSVFSDAAELTTKMKGDEHFFQPGKFPTATFKSTAVKKTDKGYDVTGDLTIRDKTKSVVLPVTDLKMDAKSLTCKSTVTLNRHDFGIEYNSTAGDYVIYDNCDLTLDVVAEAAK